MVRNAKGYSSLTSNSISFHRAGADAPVTFTFEGASASRSWMPRTPAGRISYSLGRDPSKWVKDAPQYERPHLANLCPGIDADFYHSAGSREYDLNLDPGANPDRICIRIAGSRRVSIGPKAL